MSNGYWRNGEYFGSAADGFERADSTALMKRAHKLRARYLAIKLRRAIRRLAALPRDVMEAVARTRRTAAQPWRMHGNRLGFGNRR